MSTPLWNLAYPAPCAYNPKMSRLNARARAHTHMHMHTHTHTQEDLANGCSGLQGEMEKLVAAKEEQRARMQQMEDALQAPVLKSAL